MTLSQIAHDVGVADVVDAMTKRFAHRAHIVALDSPDPDRVLFGPAVTISYLPVREDLMDATWQSRPLRQIGQEAPARRHAALHPQLVGHRAGEHRGSARRRNGIVRHGRLARLFDLARHRQRKRAPQDRRSARIEIGPDGAGEHVRTRGYGDDHHTRETFQLTPDALDALHADLRQLGAFSTPWREADRRTVGGGGQTVRLTLDGETIQVPRQLDPDQRKRRGAVVARILAAVPG